MPMGVGIAIVAAVLCWSTASRADDPKEPLGAGTVAPKLEAESWLNGAAPAEDAFKGKVVLVEFFAFW